MESLKKIRDCFTPTPRHVTYRLRDGVESFQYYLPYRYVDEQRALFINQRSLGFGLMMPVLCGASEEMVESLNEFIKKLPQGDTDIQVTMLCHNQLHPILQQQRDQMAQSGGIFETMAEMAYRFETKGAIQGFQGNSNTTVGQLRDYQVFLFRQ